MSVSNAGFLIPEPARLNIGGNRKGTMTLTCRAVDVEKVDCPKCKKKLTIRVLAYKHHRYCRAYTDRVSERTAQAQRIYDRNMRRALGDSEKYESVGDNVDDNMSDSEAMSENSTAATSESTQGPQNSAIYSGATSEATATTNAGKKTTDATSEATPELQFGEKTTAVTHNATTAAFSDKKTCEATAEPKKTSWSTRQATFEAKKTSDATSGASYHAQPRLDMIIANMFHR